MTSLPKSQISPPPSPHQPPSPSGLSSSPATVISAGSSAAAGPSLSPAPPALNMSAPPARKRLTARKTASTENITKSQQAEKDKPEIAKIGSKSEVVISGRRLLCKICRCVFFPCASCLTVRGSDRRFLFRRRELAAKEHIVAHDVGKGQQAFAPNRRDMTAYRAEQERLRREAGAPPGPMPLKAEPVALPPAAAPNPLAALRVAQPLGGGRIVQPRPSNVPRPQPVARPAPRQAAAKTSEGADRSSSEPSSATQNVGEATVASSSEANGSPATQASAVPAPASNADEAGTAAVPPPQPESPLLPSPACSSYFVEPLSWMSPFLESGVLAGKITCPNKRCGAKLGNFDWAGNRTCSHSRDDVSLASAADMLFFPCRMLVRCVGVPWLCAQRVSGGRSLGRIDPQHARPNLGMDQINCK